MLARSSFSTAIAGAITGVASLLILGYLVIYQPSSPIGLAILLILLATGATIGGTIGWSHLPGRIAFVVGWGLLGIFLGVGIAVALCLAIYNLL
ncbi:MAG: hypothetical protein FJ271_17095 [Planctomycetes bacterium]|nr:hypothetical protein [Planctomycetota bacterium]